MNSEATAAAFEAERPYLRGVAYRILGSLTDAEDVVQDAWLRLVRADPAEIADLRAWLTVVVGRLCLDQLRSARARRESYVGPWLPEPVVGTSDTYDPVAPSGAGAFADADPADRVTLAESVSMAVLVVLETLSPPERTAFVLHDVFGFGSTEIAEVTGRSPAASRQLASRARRHVRDRTPRFDPDPSAGRRTAEAFLAAAAGGDLDALVRLLDPDVVLRADGGGVVTAARRPVVGADKVARFLLGLFRKALALAADPPVVRAAEVNGGPGFLVYLDGRLVNVVALTIGGGRVVGIDMIVNPTKLRHLPDRAAD